MIQKPFLFFFLFLLISILFIPSTTRKLYDDSKGSVTGSTSGHSPSAVGNTVPGTSTSIRRHSPSAVGNTVPGTSTSIRTVKPFCDRTVYGKCISSNATSVVRRPFNQTRVTRP
ncbi:uncharacterized protein LOC111399269 [Olea europaea var. sylvestris]|uniref:uncharacterized protein LOC111399269 n=1 Tax=Olea europaea var. sylvestris TaxID=158386 RepID=UPI000C1D34D6|nr:uncharacterized protein LOC111399269 [Olea europaea var. sylvestris]